MPANPARKRPPRAVSAEDAARFYLPLYVGLGTDRSVSRVHELVTAMGIRISRTTLARYSGIGHWVEEARKFDNERADRVQHVAIDQIMNNEARQAQLGRLLQEAAIAGVARRNAPGEGVTVPMPNLSEIARVAEVGVKIERLAAGQATEIRQVLVGVYQVFIVEAVALWMSGQAAAAAVYEQHGIVDAGLHARAHNAAAEVFGPGMDALVQQHFHQWGIADIAFGDAPATEDDE